MLTLIVGAAAFLAALSLMCGLAGARAANPLLPPDREEAREGGPRREPFLVRLWGLREGAPLGAERCALAGAAAALAAFGLSVLMVDPTIAAPLALGAFLLAPRGLNRWLFALRIKRFRAAAEFGVDTMLTALNIGMPMEKALREAARHSPEPVRTEFARLADMIGGGTPEPEAFRSLVRRVPCPEAEELCDAVELYHRVGGPRALDLLRTVLANLRDGISMRYQVHQHTKGPKLSAVLVTLIPIGYLALMLTMAPDLFGPLVETQAGRTIAFVALLVYGFGVWFVLTILRSIEDF